MGLMTNMLFKDKELLEGSPWFTPLNQVENCQLRLICFSYAGGGTSAFREWVDLICDDVEIIVIQMPGRETRFVEPLATNLTDVVQEIAINIAKLSPVPFVFFGHSLGSLIAFEVTRLLVNKNLNTPERLLLSGRRAAHLPLGRPPYHLLDDDALIEKITTLGGTTEEIIANKDLMDLILPIIRADFALHDTYQYKSGQTLNVPIHVFGGEQDIATSVENLSAWQRHSIQPIELNILKGGHFFIDSARQELMQLVNDALEPLIETVTC